MWIKKQKNKEKETDSVILLKPICVSLYGITSSIQIDEAIKKELSPILNSKLVKGAKNGRYPPTQNGDIDRFLQADGESDETMTQEERWMTRYDEVVSFIEANHRNPSRHKIEEHDHLNWLKANRKAMNAATSIGKAKEHKPIA